MGAQGAIVAPVDVSLLHAIRCACCLYIHRETKLVVLVVVLELYLQA